MKTLLYVLGGALAGSAVTWLVLKPTTSPYPTPAPQMTAATIFGGWR